MKILVTGGAGFIGSNLAEALLTAGHSVCVLDNLSTGNKVNVPSQVTLHIADITDFPTVEDIFVQEQPEVIFHLAAQIDVRQSVADPVTDACINLLASLNLIQLSLRFHLKKFIFSSSGGAAYGNTEKRPTDETHPEWPLSPYGINKIAVDKYLHAFRQNQGLKYVSLRYANVYGPRQNPYGEGGVVAIFLNKMLSGENPVIYGGGEQTRDFVYVGDVVRANLLALTQAETVGLYNIGTGMETTVSKLFHIINAQFENRFEERHAEGKPGEQKTSCLSTEKMTRDFGWKAEIFLAEGVERTYEWFKNAQ